MIVCQCNRITSREIARVSAELARTQPGVPVTVEAVYQALGAQPRCGSCLPLAAEFLASPQAVSAAPDTPQQLADAATALTSSSGVR